MLKIKICVVYFSVDGVKYYTYGGMDQDHTDQQNLENRLQQVSKAVSSKGMIEAHRMDSGMTTYVNLSEAKESALIGSEVVELSGTGGF